MNALPRIIIADRSELAKNLYQLLFAPLCASITVEKRLEALLATAKRGNGPDLIIINSNVLGKKAHDAFSQISGNDKLSGLKKIFICKDGANDASFREGLGKLKNSKVIIRPFHPDEFVKLVKKYLS